MFHFIANVAEAIWNGSAQYYQFWSSFLSTTWIVIIGVLFCLVSYGILAVESRFNRDSMAKDVPLFNDVRGVITFGFLFVVMYFNDYKPWAEVDGMAGLFAWLGSLLFALGILGSVISVVMDIFFLISACFSGFWGMVRSYFISILAVLSSTFCMYTGLLLMSSFTGPVGVGIFFIACLFYPSDSTYVGQVRDRSGRVWDVFRS